MAADQTQQDRLLLLLEICEDFVSHASPAAHGEVDALLRERTGGPGWLIDTLWLTRLSLQRQHHTPALGTRPDA